MVPSVMAAVSHGVLNDRGYAPCERYFGPLDYHQFDTDPTADGVPITVLSVAELLGEGIRRIHGNESVTGLFDEGVSGSCRFCSELECFRAVAHDVIQACD